jgi:segregation and condensation protein A
MVDESGQEHPEMQPMQAEMPFAIVQGEPVTQLPRDLYIPPDALEVFLDDFEGPLDLLLYLIRRQNLDVLDIPIAEITRQYMRYVELMKEFRLELAAEYLVMAAMLAEIKSRMLLPRAESLSDEEDDPRAELVRRLQEYERFKQAAESIDEMPRLERDVFPAEVEVAARKVNRIEPEIELRELLGALAAVLRRAEMFSHHQIEREPLSVRERMSTLLTQLRHDHFTEFSQLFAPEEGRAGVVVSMLAILELLKATLIEIAQAEPFGPLHVRATGHEAEAELPLEG